MFRKVEVSGSGAHPLFKHLLGTGDDCTDDNASCPPWAENGECENNREFMMSTCKLSCKFCESVAYGAPIKWNFESFLVSRNGELHKRWATGTDLVATEQTREIEELLAAKYEL